MTGHTSLDAPRGDIGAFALAARLAVGALAPQVVFPVLSGAAPILIGPSPGIQGNRVLLEVRAVPIGEVRIPDQGFQANGGRRVGTHVQPILVQPCAQQLDLSPGRRLLGLPHAAEEPRTHQPHEQAQDDRDHDHLDEREPAVIVQEAPHPGHRATSVKEKIAISRATTMNPTSTPTTRMIPGSSSAISRLMRRRTVDSKSAAILSSMSSSRPVSSPTRTRYTAIGGNASDPAMSAAIPTPRRTPSARRAMPWTTIWFPLRSATTSSAVRTGTPLLSRVPSTRANRAMSVSSMRGPTSGSRRTKRSQCQRAQGVASARRHPATVMMAAAASTHQYCWGPALTTSRTGVDTGMAWPRSRKISTKRGTTKASRKTTA